MSDSPDDTKLDLNVLRLNINGKVRTYNVDVKQNETTVKDVTPDDKSTVKDVTPDDKSTVKDVTPEKYGGRSSFRRSNTPLMAEPKQSKKPRHGRTKKMHRMSKKDLIRMIKSLKNHK